jgi:signal transduction histidine kinase
VRRRTGNFAHALRVAAVAAAVIAVSYVAVVGVFDLLVSHRLLAQVDARLADRLQDAAPQTGEGSSGARATTAGQPADRDDDDDVDAAPVFLWHVRSDGTVVPTEAGAPVLASGSWPRLGGPVTARLGNSEFRLRSARVDGQRLVVGVSLADQIHIRDLLLVGEAVAGPLVVLGMFVGALVIGVKASAPVELARRRQLEFTADASHELRTPLSVIEAEVDLALHRDRAPVEYRQVLTRVGSEGGRLRRIVEDLLWLARFDATPPAPAQEAVDLSALAEECATRFEPLAAARGLKLSIVRGDDSALVDAPAEWMERLVGVLVDNGCRYTPDGGTVRLTVEGRAGRSALVVDDSGPGIPEQARSRLFDRFHRMSDLPGGTGLGLAIADSVVRSTGGRWHVGTSDLGGARFEITWHRSHREPSAPRPVSTAASGRVAGRVGGSAVGRSGHGGGGGDVPRVAARGAEEQKGARR